MSTSLGRQLLPLMRARGNFLLLVLAALIVGGLPVLLSVVAPNLNNSVLIAICASGQFFVSIFAGVAWSKSEAVREANMRWVPMGASACDRLATILGAVANLRATVGQACSTATKNLPELTEKRNRAVRIHFEGLCSSNATRLNDVECHLDSALADWERFIKHNCDGPECADIGRRLALLRARIPNIVPAGTGCGVQQPDTVTEAPEGNLEDLELVVNGVTADVTRNGRWILRRVADDYWESDIYVLRRKSYGWYVEERVNPDSYFFRPDTGSEFGVYERCEVCPYDGNAVIAKPASAPPSDSQQAKLTNEVYKARLVELTIALDQYLQHTVSQHRVSPEAIVRALRQANDIAAYSVLIGARCPKIVSAGAIPALNLLRGLFELSPFVYDPQLRQQICNPKRAMSEAEAIALGFVPHAQKRIPNDSGDGNGQRKPDPP